MLQVMLAYLVMILDKLTRTVLASRAGYWESVAVCVCTFEIVSLGSPLLTSFSVLLDEADVFLEERTTADQKQNAIVSGKQPPVPSKAHSTNIVVQQYSFGC
jgi:hypothetical protein